MSAARTWLVLTACAAAVGGLAGAVFVAVSGVPGAEAPRPSPAGGATSTPSAAPDAPSPTTDRPAAAGLTRRLDAPEAATRHALALELLRRGPDALPQARALRPVTPEGVDLHDRLVLALDKMRLVRRSQDYPRLPEYLRMRLDLDAFASVVPEALLVSERIAYWSREIDAVRVRLERGHADPAEEALARLELENARRAAGEVTSAHYESTARSLVPQVAAWIDAQRSERGAAPARIAELEAQLRRLRP